MLTVACSSPARLGVTPQAVARHIDSLPALPPSEINFTIKAPARLITAKADSVVPKQFVSDGWPAYLQPTCDFRYKYRFFRSGLTLTCTNNNIGVHLTGTYQIAGGRCVCAMNKPVSPWVSGSCGFGDEPLRRVNININSQLAFRSDYTVRTVTKAGKLDAIDKCSVSLFSTDVTQQVLDSIRSSLAAFCSAMDETIAGMDYKTMTRPFAEKSSGKTNAGILGYVSINPVSLRVGALNLAKDSFRISAGLVCHPAITSDSSKSTASPLLPALQNGEHKDGISLYVDAFYDYGFLSHILNDSLRNKVIDVKGRTIVVKDVGMKSLGNRRVEIRIDFAGSNKGRVYLQGTPTLDTAKQTLTIPDISYTIESADIILNVAKTLFKNRIRRTISGKSYLDVAAMVKSNLATFSAMLNRPVGESLVSTGKVNDVKLIGMLAKKTGLEVQVYMAADASLTYAPSKSQ